MLRVDRQSGFTLLEAIITLIVASLLGSMLFSYFAVVKQAVLPIGSYQKSLDLQRVMENITSDYHNIVGSEAYPRWEPLKAYSENEIITSRSIPFGHLFICVSGGISGEAEPQWSTDKNNAIEDGGVIWRESKGELEPLISDLTQQSGEGSDVSSYGKYDIKELTFIRFEDNSEIPTSAGEPENLLKLTIQNDQGESITSLFTTSY